MCSLQKKSDGWFWTSDLWYGMRPLCRLSHNQFYPFLQTSFLFCPYVYPQLIQLQSYSRQRKLYFKTTIISHHLNLLLIICLSLARRRRRRRHRNTSKGSRKRETDVVFMLNKFHILKGGDERKKKRNFREFQDQAKMSEQWNWSICFSEATEKWNLKFQNFVSHFCVCVACRQLSTATGCRPSGTKAAKRFACNW